MVYLIEESTDSWASGQWEDTRTRALVKRTGLPLFYLDQMYWNRMRGFRMEITSVHSRCGKKRAGMLWVEEEPDEEFLPVIRSFQFDTRPGMFALFMKYIDKELIVFKSRAEAVQWLKQIR